MTLRRRFIQQSAAAASSLAFPLIAGAQPKAVKVGILHPVTGALAYSGAQCREGAGGAARLPAGVPVRHLRLPQAPLASAFVC